MREEKFAVVDVETTGLNVKKDEILSIAIIPMDGLKILFSEAYYRILKPRKFKVDSVKYHGITPRMVEEAPTFCEVKEEILEKLKERIIVGYSINLDIEFLKKSFKECEIIFECKYVDVADVEKLIGRLFGDYTKDVTLEELAKKYGVDIAYRHSALSDAYITAQIFQMQLLRLLKYGLRKFEDVLRAIKKEDFYDRPLMF